MLIKKTSKNQIVIPKALIKQANLDENDISFFDIGYHDGSFFLRPMRAEEVISDDEFYAMLDRFEREAKAKGLSETDVAKEIKLHRQGR